MKAKIIIVLVVIATLFTGCTMVQNEVKPKNNLKEQVAKPSKKVQALIDKFDLKVVDFEYTKKAIGKGTRASAKAILIDARPIKKYKAGTIPSSLNIPDTKYADFVGQLKNIPKDKEIIVFCGGWKCAKSPKVAGMLKKDGFTNVKLYQAGEPQWVKKTYKEVDLVVVKAAQAKNSALLVDARPYKKYLKETIPGSIAIPDTKIDKLIGRFPINKDERIIVYCGGWKCAKSHKVARILIAKGYKNVSVFAGGLPTWKKAALPTTTGGLKAKSVDKAVKTSAKFSKNGVKLGADEGSVDGEWFKKLIKTNTIPKYIQIVDVKDPSEFKSGHLKGAINIYAEKLSAKKLYAKLPKGKSIVMNCSAGGRSLEAWMKLSDAKYDISEIFYFDANIDCKNTNCKIEVNEPIE